MSADGWAADWRRGRFLSMRRLRRLDDGLLLLRRWQWRRRRSGLGNFIRDRDRNGGSLCLRRELWLLLIAGHAQQQRQDQNRSGELVAPDVHAKFCNIAAAPVSVWTTTQEQRAEQLLSMINLRPQYLTREALQISVSKTREPGSTRRATANYIGGCWGVMAGGASCAGACSTCESTIWHRKKLANTGASLSVNPFVACRAEAGHKKEDKDPIHPKGLRRERVLNLSEKRLVPFLGMANVLSEERTHNESPRSCFGNDLGD
jgi:hypothetical protein